MNEKSSASENKRVRGRPKKSNDKNATLHLLVGIANGASAAELARAIPLDPSVVSRKIKQLKEQGFVVSKRAGKTTIEKNPVSIGAQSDERNMHFGRGRWQQYALTKAGKVLLEIVSKGHGKSNTPLFPAHYRLHHLMLVFKLEHVKDFQEALERLSAEGFKKGARGAVRGWLARFPGVRCVLFNGEGIVLYLEKIHALSPETCLLEAFRRGNAAREWVQKLSGVRLSQFASVRRQQVAMRRGFSDWVHVGYRWEGDHLVVDWSFGPEYEAQGTLDATERMNRVSVFMDEVAATSLRPKEIVDFQESTTSAIAAIATMVAALKDKLDEFKPPHEGGIPPKPPTQP